MLAGPGSYQIKETSGSAWRAAETWKKEGPWIDVLTKSEEKQKKD